MTLSWDRPTSHRIQAAALPIFGAENVSGFTGIGEKGGRAFCHIDQADQRTYVTWTSEAGKKILIRAQLNGLQHRHLFIWWRSVRHDIV
jgi:hypothetical protein